MEQEDLYQILGIAKDASEVEVRAACRRLLGQVHPDRGGSDALFRVVYRAYAVLTDPVRRAAYDEQLRRGDDPDEDERDPRSRASAQDELGPWLNPEAPRRDHRLEVDPEGRGHAGAIVVTHHPSLSLLLASFVLFIAAWLAQLRGLASLALVLGAVAALGQMGRRRALDAEAARRARIAELDQMSAEDFVSHLTTVLRRDGFAARAVTTSKDARADLIVRKDDVTTAVALHQASETVEADAVRSLGGVRAHYRVDRTLMLTNAQFSSQAVALATKEEVTLIGRTELIALMATQENGPRFSGLVLWAGELAHGPPAAIGLVGSALVGLQCLLDSVIALGVNTVVLEEVAVPVHGEAREHDATAS